MGPNQTRITGKCDFTFCIAWCREEMNYLYILKEKSCLAYQGCISMKAELILEGNWQGTLHILKDPHWFSADTCLPKTGLPLTNSAELTRILI